MPLSPPFPARLRPNSVAAEVFGVGLTSSTNRTIRPAWAWIGEHFRVRDANTGKPAPFIVFPWMARILLDLLPETAERLPYNLGVYSTTKKSGKTTTAAAIAAYLLFERGPAGSEHYVFANSQDQSIGRVFAAAKYAAERSPMLIDRCASVQTTSVTLDNGTFIRAMAAMNANVAGSNPYASYWTELWGYSLENERRTWDEMTPPPTVLDSIRIVDTYAGYEGESTLLNSIEDQLKTGQRLHADGYTLPAAYLDYAREIVKANPALRPYMMPQGQDGGVLTYDTPLPCYVDERSYGYWDDGEEARRMPWQRGEVGAAYYRDQERKLLPGAFRRFHLNRRAKRGGQYVPVTTWDMLPTSDPWRPGDRRPVVLGLDAATSSDHMALVGVRMIGTSPEECYTQEWEPTPNPLAGGRAVIDPADALVELRRLKAAGMRILAVTYDPYQLASVALAASAEGFTMVEFNQGPKRLLADTGLRQRVMTGTLAHTHSPVLRAALENADAKEENTRSGDGGRWRIVKGAGKVDSLVALSMALHHATDGLPPPTGEPLPEGMKVGEMLMSAPMDDVSTWEPERGETDYGSMFVGR